MSAPDSFLYEYAVVRYVPRVDREEFINIGLIMMCKRRKWLKGRIELNRARIKAFDPGADVDLIAVQSAFFSRDDVPSAHLPVEEKYRWLAAVKSAVLQVSASHPGLINKLDITDKKEAEELLENEFERLLKEKVL